MAYLDENGLEHFWGKIKDRVSSAVAPKANDADVVHRTGDETIDGLKTFVSTENNHNVLLLRNKSVVRGVAPASRTFSYIYFLDNENPVDPPYTGRLAGVVYDLRTDGSASIDIQCNDFNTVTDFGKAKLSIGYDGNGTAYTSTVQTSDSRSDPADVVTRGYMEASEWNWQKTKKAGAVAFKPVPDSDLEPIVNFMFTETPPVEGEKGPENPSTITGVAQAKVTRCGKNLIDLSGHPDTGSSTTKNGVTFSMNTNGEITCSGTATARTSYFFVSSSANMKLHSGTYTLSGMPDSSFNTNVVVNIGTYLSLNPETGYINSATDTGNGASFTINEDRYAVIGIAIASGTTLNNYIIRPQLELGSTATAFEPYAGIDYTIQLGDTYYGGSLDVATGVMTVTQYGMTLKGTENFVAGSHSDYYLYSLNNSTNPALSGDALRDALAANPDLEKCTHFEIRNNVNTTIEHCIAYGNIIAFITTQSSLANFKSWLATQYSSETPVTIVYPLATPFTVQLTPQQIRSLPALDKYEPRINTVYTDQEAVQVGYQRFANYVDLTTDQTINGNKTFTYPVVYAGNHSTAFQAKIPEIERGNVTTSIYKMPFFVNDKNDRRTCGLYEEVLSSGEHNISLLVFDATSINNTYTYLKVGFDENQIPYAFAPFTPFSRVNGHDIVTRSYIVTAAIYVDAVNGNDSNEGTSASNAFKTIGTALSKVSHRPRCTIHIAAGTYTENITITESSYFIFKLYGNVVINGNFVVTRNSGLHISPNNSAYTFTVKSLIVSYVSFLYSDAKFITTYSGVSCYDESEIAFNYGVDITINTGNSQYGLYANVESYVYVNKELSIQAGSASGSNVNNALFAYKSSFILINNTTTNITCAGPVIASDMQSTIFIHNDSYSDSNNTFTATTSTRNAIYAMGGYIRTDNIKISITHTRDENTSGNVIVNLNDNSTFRLNSSQLNLTCTGKTYNFIGAFYNSVFIFGSSNSLTFNGASYAGTINCQYNSCVFISSAATVSGTVTSGYRFYVSRGGQINIQGHSAGLNRIPGASAGTVESSSYGYYG